MLTSSLKTLGVRNLVIGLVVFLLSIAAFSSALTAEFVHWDDDINIVNNPHIHQLNSDSLFWMFTDFSYTPRYRPLNWLSWSVLYRFFGDNAAPYHATTLVLHALNAAMLFYLITRLLQQSTRTVLSVDHRIFCGLAVLVWALHPLRVEAVAWVNCQIYTQSLFFLLLALVFYLKAVEDTNCFKTPSYWGGLTAFICSLLTYPTGVAFVVVLFTIDCLVLKRIRLLKPFFAGNRQILLEKVPFAMATIAVGVVALWARTHATPMWSEISDAGRLGILDQAAQAFYVWGYYLWKQLAFVDLSPVYTQLVEFRWTQWPFLLSAVLIIGASVFLIMNRRKQPVLLGLWVCYLALLVPMLGLTEHPHYPNDRYSYIVSVLLSILVAAGGFCLSKRNLRLAGTGLAFILVGFATVTARQTQIWRNSDSLFTYVLNQLGEDPYRADILWRVGRVHAEKRNFAKATDAYLQAVKIQPRFSKAHVDLATVYYQTGRTNEALRHYRQALEVRPGDPLANYNMAVVLEAQGKFDEALNSYNTAVESDPRNVDYRLALAATLGRLGRRDECVGHLQAALKVAPRSPKLLLKVGSAYAAQQRLPDAIELFQKALTIDPRNGEAHYNLGTALAMSGKVADATAHFIQAAHLQPNSPQHHLACGMAFAQTGKPIEATDAYRAAIKLQPDMLPAMINLCWLLSASPDPKVRNGTEAVTLAEMALKIVGEGQPEAFDMLAAAYAEAGKWKEAVATAQKGSKVASSIGRMDLSVDLERKMKLYEAGQALRIDTRML